MGTYEVKGEGESESESESESEGKVDDSSFRPSRWDKYIIMPFEHLHRIASRVILKSHRTAHGCTSTNSYYKRRIIPVGSPSQICACVGSCLGERRVKHSEVSYGVPRKATMYVVGSHRESLCTSVVLRTPYSILRDNPALVTKPRVID
jgi:hypothetical protein